MSRKRLTARVAGFAGWSRNGLLALATTALVAATAFAGNPPPGGETGSGGGVPEIDPGSMVSGLTLLVGGALLLIERFRRRAGIQA